MVEHAPVEVPKEVIVEHVAPVEVVQAPVRVVQSPAKEVIRREPQVIRSTAPVEVRRVVMDKTCGETIRRSYKTQEYVPAIIEEVKESVVEKVITKEPEVI